VKRSCRELQRSGNPSRFQKLKNLRKDSIFITQTIPKVLGLAGRRSKAKTFEGSKYPKSGKESKLRRRSIDNRGSVAEERIWTVGFYDQTVKENVQEIRYGPSDLAQIAENCQICRCCVNLNDSCTQETSHFGFSWFGEHHAWS
jgi:hypothetical protein